MPHTNPSQTLLNPLQDIADIIQQRLDQFRDKWLPRNPAVKKALALKASEGKSGTVEEYKEIVDGLMAENKFLEKEAFTDPLTARPNRNAFDAALEHIITENSKAIDEGKKPEDLAPTTVIFLDLNYLKQLNNISFGNGGDKAIQYLSDYVTKKLRKPDGHTATPEGDLFARFGGDELGIIMKNCTKEQADLKIRKIVEDMARDSLDPVNGCICTDDHTHQSAAVQVSAAFGSAELLKELPEVEKTGNKEEDIKKIMTLSMSAAQQAEKLDKSDSKKFAASIVGGMPQADDREEAEKTVRAMLEKRFGYPSVEGSIQSTPPAVLTQQEIKR